MAGIDLGGTNMLVGVVDEKGRVVGRCKRKTKAGDGRESVLTRLVEAVDRACVEAKLERKDLAAVGIGAPSAIDVDRGVVLNAGNLGWKNVPLRDLLGKRTGLPVVVDNDVNVAALGEASRSATPHRFPFPNARITPLRTRFHCSDARVAPLRTRFPFPNARVAPLPTHWQVLEPSVSPRQTRAANHCDGVG